MSLTTTYGVRRCNLCENTITDTDALTDAVVVEMYITAALLLNNGGNNLEQYAQLLSIAHGTPLTPIYAAKGSQLQRQYYCEGIAAHIKFFIQNAQRN